jgi:hypothetical protein
MRRTKATSPNHTNTPHSMGSGSFELYLFPNQAFLIAFSSKIFLLKGNSPFPFIPTIPKSAGRHVVATKKHQLAEGEISRGEKAKLFYYIYRCYVVS